MQAAPAQSNGQAIVDAARSKIGAPYGWGATGPNAFDCSGLTSWAFRQHRQWWAHRAISFPWFFGTVYGLFLLWGVTQMARSSMTFW